MHREGRTRESRKRTVVALATAAALVGIAAVVTLRQPLVERWHLWRLESSDLETRLQAMSALTRMQSPRAASRFAEMAFEDMAPKPPDFTSGNAATWFLLSYGCETWVRELRRTLAATGRSEAEFVQRNSAVFLQMLRDMTGKEQGRAATLEDLCEILMRFKDLVATMK